MLSRTNVGSKTDPGQARPRNEDYLGYREPAPGSAETTRGALYVVADGVGGHNAGEVASEMAVQTILREYYAVPFDDADVTANLQHAIEVANAQVFDQAQTSRGENGMGTTIVAAVVRDNQFTVAHVGDSRAYLIREDQILQLTEDHSWVSEQIAAGLLTSEEAASHPYRHHITRALGNKETVAVDARQRSLQAGDIVVLCSDGLTNVVGEDRIRQVVSLYEPQEACDELVQEANTRGGPDNISLIMVHISEVTPVEEEEPSPSSLPVPRKLESRSRVPAWVWVCGGFVIGLLVGWWAIGWWLWPVEWTDAGLADLTHLDKKLVILLVSERYAADHDLFLAHQPLQQLGDPEQIALMIDELISEPDRPIEEIDHLRQLAEALRTEGSQEITSAEPTPVIVIEPKGEESAGAFLVSRGSSWLYGGSIFAGFVLVATVVLFAYDRNQRRRRQRARRRH